MYLLTRVIPTYELQTMIFRRMSHDNNKWAINQLPLSFARDSAAWRSHK